MRARRLVFFVFDQARLIDVTGPLEVFATANALADRELYRIAVASPDGKDVVSGAGASLGVDSRVAELPDCVDLLFVPGTFIWAQAIEDQALLDALQEAATKSRWLASVCAGSFLLAAIGALDGRRAATHWDLVGEFARRFPEVRVEPDPIFVEDGRVYTSAGGTAGIDLALAILETHHGPDLARSVAQWLVVFMQRPGGQAQFSARMRFHPKSEGGLRGLLDSIAADPTADHSLAALSARAGFSERHLSRLFKDQLGLTPAQYVETVRMEAARAMLEVSDAPLAVIAEEAGLSSAETMRRAFARELGITPNAYRQRFHTTGISAPR
ncbi:MAG: GlxA family transcriptional regulator [Actinobacteria bacterium]|nr:GlxA family transcriptional regulator [Actinomycetota bacterium]